MLQVNVSNKSDMTPSVGLADKREVELEGQAQVSNKSDMTPSVGNSSEEFSEYMPIVSNKSDMTPSVG